MEGLSTVDCRLSTQIEVTSGFPSSTSTTTTCPPSAIGGAPGASAQISRRSWPWSSRMRPSPNSGVTREEMADYLGLTLETVSRQISALKKDGVITLEGNRHVSIPDMDRLLEEAGDDSDGGMLV